MKLTGQLFMSLYPAQVISLITSNLAGVVDSLIIGNVLPASALVALGLATPVLAIICMISTIVSGGARVLCGKSMGRGDLKEIDRIFSASMVLLTILGVLITIVIFIFTPAIGRLLNPNGENFAEISSYLRGTAIGFIPLLLNPCLMVFLQIGNESKLVPIYAFFIAIVDMILDIVGIKLMNGGMFAAGLATALTQYIAFFMMAVHFKNSKTLSRFGFMNADVKMAGKLLKLGAPVGLLSILYNARNIIFNAAAMKYIGSDAVGAMTIITNVDNIHGPLNGAVGSTILLLASLAIGERDEKMLGDEVGFSLKLSGILTIFKIAVFLPFAEVLGRAFGADGLRLEMTALLFRMLTLSIPFNFIFQILINCHVAQGRTNLAAILSFLAAFVIPVPYFYLMSRLGSVAGMWMVHAVADISVVAILTVYTTIKCGHFPRNIKEWLLLGGEMSYGDRLNFTVKNAHEVTEVSRTVESFLRAHGADDRRSQFSGLCLEEMAGNVVEHGFTKAKGKKDLAINIFVCYEDETVRLRIRDNAPPFDPRTRLGVQAMEDPFKNVGIRLVASIAKDMNYNSKFGMNVLTVEL